MGTIPQLPHCRTNHKSHVQLHRRSATQAVTTAHAVSREYHNRSTSIAKLLIETTIMHVFSWLSYKIFPFYPTLSRLRMSCMSSEIYWKTVPQLGNYKTCALLPANRGHDHAQQGYIIVRLEGTFLYLFLVKDATPRTCSQESLLMFFLFLDWNQLTDMDGRPGILYCLSPHP